MGHRVYGIILAAGMGTRLGGETPKPLTKIRPGLSLIGNQINILGRLIGRDRITIVIGHERARFIEAYPDLTHICNERYAITNTAKSLLCALEELSGDVLWTNGDVFFEQATIQSMLNTHKQYSRVLVNRALTTDEEVKYSLATDGSIRELSKEVESAAGESLGVQIVVKSDLASLVEELRRVGDGDYFEKALENATLNGRIRLMPVDVAGAFCREVDYPEDLEAVRAHVAAREEP